MKITKIETFQLEAKLERPFGWSQGLIDHREVGVVKITTAGIVGWGEGCRGAAATIIHAVFAPKLIGADPMNRVGLWQTMFNMLYKSNHTIGFGTNAISAIDIALWDIAGKALGAPVCDLLGGRVRDKVAVYVTGLYYTEDDFPGRLLDEACGYVDVGFKGMKAKIGGLSIDEDVARVAAIREAIGPDIQLTIDANQGYNASTAIRMGRRLADLDLFWFEEPVNAQDLDAYLQVKTNIPMAIAGGENLRTRYEFGDMLKRGAYDFAQPDIGNVGSVAEMVKVAAIANTFGIHTYPYVWGSPIMIAATLHVVATLAPTPAACNPLPYQ